MAISRMQEPRQLYGLGSLVRKITRPIKKAVRGVKKVVNSPLGRTALLAAASAYGLGALGSGGFNPLAKGFFSKANLAEGLGTFFSTKNPLLFKGDKFNLGRAGLTASALGAALPFLAPNLLAPQQQEMEEVDITQTPESIALLNQRARDFYNYGDENLLFMPAQQYVSRNFFAKDGGSVPESKVKGYDTPAGFNKFDYPSGGVEVRTPKKEGGKLTEYDRNRAGALMRPKFEKGGGLMDLGGLEMDFRAEGGFVPIGAKEKADDVPARLSKNEFVMTADAVRGAGNGSIKAGAQKMYNTMKELERRVG